MTASAMRVKLDDPTLVDDLAVFLRRCEWGVDRVSANVIEIRVPHRRRMDAGRELVRAGLCLDCGTPIGESLVELGATYCHDCHGREDGRVARSPAFRLELEGYLRVWSALHRPATATILDDVLPEAV